MLSLAVMASGSGTILEAIMRADLRVDLVVVDRECRALTLATDPTENILVDRPSFGGFGPGFDRDAYTDTVTDVLLDAEIDLIAMAGFGTVLGNRIFDAFGGRILNTHPSLLPAFPGWNGVEDALKAGATVTGCTVHLATLEMDSGPILAQESVDIRSGDSAEGLHERIKAVERVLYPDTIRRALDTLAAGRPLDSLAISSVAT